jgi:phosphoribosylformylglycinamidine synthase
MFLARVFITLKSTINDPQGQTIRSGLRDMGYGSVASVRAGKYMEVSLDEDNEADAASHVESMCERLLANPVIEEYRYELTRVE